MSRVELSEQSLAIVEAIDRLLDAFGRCSELTDCQCPKPARIRCEREAGHHGAHAARIVCRPDDWGVE